MDSLSRYEVSEDVQKTLDWIHGHWVKCYPTEATNRGTLYASHHEDLSDNGIEHWKVLLRRFREQIISLLEDTWSGLDRVVLNELLRFVNDQEMKYDGISIYKRSFRAHLQLYCFGLLPFFLQERFDSFQLHYCSDNFQGRINAISTHLQHAKKLIDARKMAFTEQDKIVLAQTQRFLAKWDRFRTMPQSQRVLFDMKFLSRREAVRPHFQPSSISLRGYVSSILGYDISVAELQDSLLDELRRAVDEINKNTGSRSTNSSPIQQDICDIPEDEILSLAFQELKSCVDGHFDFCVTNDVFIEVAPQLIQPFVTDALFIDTANWFRSPTAPRAMAFVSPFILKQANSSLMFAELIRILAHEICPGHMVHLQMVEQPSLKKLLEITCSPMGFEGWAVFSESILEVCKHITVKAPEVYYYHLARRYATALSYLLCKSKNTEKEAKFSAVLDELPSKYRTAINDILKNRNAVTVNMLVYPIGHYVIKNLFRSMSGIDSLPKAENSIAYSYLSFGPLNPIYVADLMNGSRRWC